ncbi:MAG: DUF6516 family protein [Candidatus Woesearchaeota archaeon]
MKPKDINKRYNIPYGTARYILKQKLSDDEYITELRLIKVPKDQNHPEGIRYTLVLIDKKTGKRIIGFDNFERKGHHIHINNIEFPYEFRGIFKLIQDFYKEVKRVKSK